MTRTLVLLLLLLLSGCARAQETILAQANSSDAWHVVAATRHGRLAVGTTDVVIGVQDPMHAWMAPGDVQLTLKLQPAHPTPAETPPPVELQPDGQPGHWLAIMELPHADTWHCQLGIGYHAAQHTAAFDLQN